MKLFFCSQSCREKPESMAQGSRTRQAHKISYLYCISMSIVRQPHQHFKTGNTAAFSSVAGKHKGQLSNKITDLVVSQGHILHDPNIIIKLPCLEKGKSFFFFFNPNACLKKHMVLSRSLSLAHWWSQKSSMLAVVCMGEAHSQFHKQTCQFLDVGPNHALVSTMPVPHTEFGPQIWLDPLQM